MKHFLIDYENIKADGIKNISDANKDDAFYIFYSEQCKNISLEVVESLTARGIGLHCYKVKTGTKNALDFQLASFLGYLIGKGNQTDQYHIVSNDKGFDCLCDYWQEQKQLVDRLGTIQLQSQKQTVISDAAPKKKRSKVLERDIASLEEIRNYLADDEDPEQVLAIFNQYKSKQAICNGMAKKFKDSKKTSVIYKKLKPLLKEKHKS